MSEAPASHAFLPWLRRGVATAIDRVDGTGPDAPRARFPVTVLFEGRDPSEAPTVLLELQGPGEVVGIDRRMIVRTDPAPDVFDAESNYFPLIEFDQPDFPWRYTPAAATAENRLRPWLVLIALADEEIAAATDADPLRGTLPTVTVADDRHLPNLAQSWAWAHVQIAGLEPDRAGDLAEIARIDREEPQRTVARLLCPRHLRPRTAYTALLVPAFERGRLAGFGRDPAAIDALAPAWPADPAVPVTLPVYFQWRFQTADAGDFESLVRELLPPKVLTAAVGRRTMDASQPGAGLPPATLADGAALTLEGALMSPASRDSLPSWTNRQPFVGALEDRLNAPADLLAGSGGPPAIAPPLYGRWYAGRPRLEAHRAPSWFDEVNGDPRLRAIAGLGARVVRDQQNQLLAAAWDQVEGVLEANRQLRQAQMGTAVATRLVERDLAGLEAGAVMAVTAPILGRVMASPRTIRATLKDSPLPEGVLEPQFRRLTRPLGPVGRRHARMAGRSGRFGIDAIRVGGLLERLNRGELPLPPPAVGAGLSTLAKTLGQAAPPQTGWQAARPVLLALLALVLLLLALLVLPLPLRLLFAGLGLAAAAATWVAGRGARRRALLAGLGAGTLDAVAVFDTPAAHNFVPRERGFSAAAPSSSARPAVPPTLSARESTARFQVALAGLAERLAAPQAATVVGPPANLEMLRAKVMEAIRPERTIPRTLGRRLNLPAEVERDPEDTAPLMASPVFDLPMYEPLRDLSPDWLLPGVGEVPPNTVSLLVANRRFIEAYMLGLNHEMARELLWHEYPTDRRGSFFRQFWDTRGYAGPAETELRDIAPIRDWAADSRLGTHPAAGPAEPAEPLVLLIRGRLLQRYPGTLVFAVRARLNDGTPVAQGGRRELGEEQRHPRFHGRLDPDIVFVGFDLTREQVIGNEASTDDEDQGWFFVFQELPTAPRFGLNAADDLRPDAATWAELSWGHLVHDSDELKEMAYIDLDPAPRYEGDRPLPAVPAAGPDDPPGLAWHVGSGSRSPDLAYIALRRPYRVAVHGSDMLP